MLPGTEPRALKLIHHVRPSVVAWKALRIFSDDPCLGVGRQDPLGPEDPSVNFDICRADIRFVSDSSGHIGRQLPQTSISRALSSLIRREGTDVRHLCLVRSAMFLELVK